MSSMPDPAGGALERTSSGRRRVRKVRKQKYVLASEMLDADLGGVDIDSFRRDVLSPATPPRRMVQLPASREPLHIAPPLLHSQSTGALFQTSGSNLHQPAQSRSSQQQQQLQQQQHQHQQQQQHRLQSTASAPRTVSETSNYSHSSTAGRPAKPTHIVPNIEESYSYSSSAEGDEDMFVDAEEVMHDDYRTNAMLQNRHVGQHAGHLGLVLPSHIGVAVMRKPSMAGSPSSPLPSGFGQASSSSSLRGAAAAGGGGSGVRGAGGSPGTGDGRASPLPGLGANAAAIAEYDARMGAGRDRVMTHAGEMSSSSAAAGASGHGKTGAGEFDTGRKSGIGGVGGAGGPATVTGGRVAGGGAAGGGHGGSGASWGAMSLPGRVAASEIPMVAPPEEEDVEAEGGGIVFHDKVQLELQRRVAWDLAKQIGNNLLEGKDMTKISLPVTIFEARSFLERVTDYWCYMPHFLPKAAASSDPMERFRLVMAFGIGGLYNTCKQRKPFNPILGETFNASYEDGTRIFMEQSSHHPPVSLFEVEGPRKSFRYYGFIHFMSSFGGNSLRGQWSGLCCVEFPDGTKIEWEMPPCYIRGIMWGVRRFQYIEKMTFRYPAHGLECTVVFNPDQKGMLRSMFSRGPKPQGDVYRGDITRCDPSVMMAEKADKKAKKCTQATGKTVGKVEGSWINYCDIDGKRLWTSAMPKFGVIPVRDPLLSDSRFREDLQALANDDVEGAREMKILLEEKQRFDNKLRVEWAKKAKKEKK